MGTPVRPAVVGTELPIIGCSDSPKWIHLSLPHPPPHYNQLPAAAITNHPQDCASSSCYLTGDPPLTFIWRIHKANPHSLELLQLSSSPRNQFPTTGLRLTFPHPLFPFAAVTSSSSSTNSYYLLYAVTASGIAYLLKLPRHLSSYTSLAAFPPDDITHFDLQSHWHSNNANANAAAAAEPPPITSVAATSGCLVVGWNDGSVFSFQLGSFPPTAPGFVRELRDDSGIGRLWGFISRSRIVGAVQDSAILEAYGLKLLFVLHSDGMLRVWELSRGSRILSQAMSIPNSEGNSYDFCFLQDSFFLLSGTFSRLWIGKVAEDSSIIPLAILCRHTLETRAETLCIYYLNCTVGERVNFSLESSMQNIALEEGECVDVKLTSEKIWILKDNGLVSHNLFHTDTDVEDCCCYTLQDEFIAEQLFQSSDHSSEELLWITFSAFSSMKDSIIPFVSNIFLRRLLQPGVLYLSVLRSTLLDYNKHWTDSEFHSLTVDGLKKEICSLIEHEGFGGTPLSMFSHWKTFCARYLHHWCKNHSPCGLLVESSVGAVGLIRQNSVSLFRDLEGIELVVDGAPDVLVDVINFGMNVSDEDSECEILSELLRCIVSMSQQLGKSASAIFYESLVSRLISSEEIVPRLMKILEVGYSSSVSMLYMSDIGSDFAWEKELADHKNLRKFSITMLLSLNALSRKATSWGKVLNVIEKYLQFLVPRKIIEKSDASKPFEISASVLVQATIQISKVMFESAVDILLFLNYLLNVSGQIGILHEDKAKIQLELVPMVQETVSEWLIINFLGSTPSESPAIEDFTSQLSLLQIDNGTDKRSWSEKLGKCDFTLASIILLTSQAFSEVPAPPSSQCFPNPQDISNSVQAFISWIIWGRGGVEFSSFSRRSTEIALMLLRHGQYDAVEKLLTIVEANLLREKVFRSIQEDAGDWCRLHHILGCCLLAQAQCGFHGVVKERKVSEAIRCFYRASSGVGAYQALKELSPETGLPHIDFDGTATWKLDYYQWAMQIFEQYNISGGACQFALAALEQVDEALSQKVSSSEQDVLNESATAVKGRLWANVFKFTLDVNNLYDAFCAILSNPDEESKYICLRRFVIVLYERGAMKVLCDGQLPFTGLAEKIERELAWKAERSDILVKPNPYKLLYAFEMSRHNWRRAARYMYQYSGRLRTEVVLKDQQQMSLVLQERLSSLSAAINALLLVHPAYAWIDPPLEGKSQHNETYPSKKSKILLKTHSGDDVQPFRLQSCIDVQELENEFVLTSAEYLLSLENVKWTCSGVEKVPSDLVNLLVQSNLYDMAFTVVLKFWRGSGLKRELEKVFSEISLKCCPSKLGSSFNFNHSGVHGLLLTSSLEETHRSPDLTPPQQAKGGTQWETLELYLEKYKTSHAGLPVTVAETLLQTDPQIELPLWLVHMFKDGRRDRTWGMSGQESNASSLFRLYVKYGRYTEATNLLLEYIESFASVRPSELINRKRPSAAWFPYTTIERLWCQLEDLIKLGHKTDQYEKLKRLLHGALLKHLKQLKVDSEDAVSSAA
ncbi:hypothetical protein Tsubulata_025329 [Turnera subulata]|uniref:Nuclear pore complex protein NUP160 domain-containing protein n=1 Tax=Turnera subulata TaxID=218843 RepID=A0A9Q0FE21_9ROSI|nr:hypothetical protein Tsubulata_025329 [Turnera subulata]